MLNSLCCLWSYNWPYQFCPLILLYHSHGDSVEVYILFHFLQLPSFLLYSSVTFMSVWKREENGHLKNILHGPLKILIK